MNRRLLLSNLLVLGTACGSGADPGGSTLVERAVLTQLSSTSPLGARTLAPNFAHEWTVSLALEGEPQEEATLLVVFGVAGEATQITRDPREFDHCVLGTAEVLAASTEPTPTTTRGLFTAETCDLDALGPGRLQPFVLVGPPSDMTMTADENRRRFETESRLLLGGGRSTPGCASNDGQPCASTLALERTPSPTPFVQELAVPEVVALLPPDDDVAAEAIQPHVEATAQVGVWGHVADTQDLPPPLQLTFFVRSGDVTVPIRVESGRENLASLLGDPAAEHAARLRDAARIESHEVPARGQARSVSASLFFEPGTTNALRAEALTLDRYRAPPQQLIACIGPADAQFLVDDIDTSGPSCAVADILLLSPSDLARLRAAPAIAADDAKPPAAAERDDAGKSSTPSYSKCVDRIPQWYRCAPYGHPILSPLVRSRGDESLARARLSMGPYFGVGRSPEIPEHADMQEVTDLLVSECGPFAMMYLMSLDTPCPVTIVTMKLGAEVSAWGKHLPYTQVFDGAARANITVDDAETGYSAVAQLSFFGHQLMYHPVPDDSSDSATEIQIPGFSNLPHYTKEFCQEGGRIHKWGVDLKFQVCARGTVGLTGDGTLYAGTVSPDDGGTTNQTLGDRLSPRWSDGDLQAMGMFRTHVTPYANIALVAEADANASIVHLSVDGTVDLADFRLSDHRGSSGGAAVDLLVGMSMDESQTPPRPTALVHQRGAKAYLHGSFLDGNLRLHARADLGIVHPHHSWTLASWNGFDWYRKIYEEVSDLETVNLSPDD